LTPPHPSIISLSIVETVMPDVRHRASLPPPSSTQVIKPAPAVVDRGISIFPAFIVTLSQGRRICAQPQPRASKPYGSPSFPPAVRRHPSFFSQPIVTWSKPTRKISSLFNPMAFKGKQGRGKACEATKARKRYDGAWPCSSFRQARKEG